MESSLSRLKFSQWLLICFALSTIGTILMHLVLAAYQDYRAGDLGHTFSNPYFDRSAYAELAAIFLGLNLMANLLGAGALVSIFAIRRRLQRR